MDAKTAKNFYDNYGWFNRFYDDLFDLYDRIVDSLEQKLRYTEAVGRQYYKNQRKPSLPDTFTMLLTSSDGGPRLQVVALLQKEWENPRMRMSEPMIAVVAYSEHLKNNWTAMAYMDRYVLNGKFDAGDEREFTVTVDENPKVRFGGFLVSLDAFSEDKCTDVDETIRERIVEPLQKILEKYFPDTGRNTKTPK